MRTLTLISTTLLVGSFLLPSAYAETKECKRLSQALEVYRIAEKNYSAAFSDDLSIQRDSKNPSTLLRKLSTQRVSMRKARAESALKELRQALTRTKAGKDWEIPNYEGVSNYRHMVFFIVAVDVACP